MKKRYGKFTARYLFCSVLCTVMFPIAAIFYFVLSLKSGDLSDNISIIAVFLGLSVISFLGAVLLTKRINKRTPPDERKETWFRAFKLGAKINFNGAFKLVGLICHCTVGFDTDIPREDTVSVPTSRNDWYEKRKYVYDENGNKYEVGRSGGYIQDKSGNWIKVERDNDGEPYFRSDSGNKWLK